MMICVAEGSVRPMRISLVVQKGLGSCTHCRTIVLIRKYPLWEGMGTGLWEGVYMEEV
jgi:hypothetical protein